MAEIQRQSSRWDNTEWPPQPCLAMSAPSSCSFSPPPGPPLAGTGLSAPQPLQGPPRETSPSAPQDPPSPIAGPRAASSPQREQLARPRMEQLCACAKPLTAPPGERRVKGRRAGFLEGTGKEGGTLLPLLPSDVPSGQSGLAFAWRALLGV
uniref:REST corepressor 2-like n=1 Tax=Podarcis muralis TaxID=64176 RepID=UPI0010A02E14|nr:REST corepressor 2-like [Podarcis muralis]